LLLTDLVRGRQSLLVSVHLQANAASIDPQLRVAKGPDDPIKAELMVPPSTHTCSLWSQHQHHFCIRRVASTASHHQPGPRQGTCDVATHFKTTPTYGRAQTSVLWIPYQKNIAEKMCRWGWDGANLTCVVLYVFRAFVCVQALRRIGVKVHQVLWMDKRVQCQSFRWKNAKFLCWYCDDLR
jgi:hypothetical protein